MRFPRASGILLHPTSLPGPHGIGELGPEAFRFADWLAEAGQKIWQVLPLGPTGYGDSPYQCFSAFAGNPLLISLDLLVDRGYLSGRDIAHDARFPRDRVDYGAVIQWKLPVLAKAAKAFFRQTCDRDDFDRFCDRNAHWLDHFAPFMAGKQLDFDEGVQRYWQFEFARQWSAVHEYCRRRGVRIMGDLAIYVAGDSSDVASHPGLFRTDVVSGVPPDYFSAAGQLWGNPIYRWDKLKETGYEWWIDRFRAVLAQVDMVRVDHFRGFEAYWEIPAGDKTAVNGRWVNGPGAELFHAVEARLGKMPIVAENLGVITPEVEAIRHELGYPGMSILQFAFGKDPQGPSFRPHNYPRELVAYTGTHDNDTTLGWWTSEAGADSTRTTADIAAERDFAKRYLRTDGREMNWVFIQAIIASVADTVLVPLQDVLGVGSEARMNLPARPDGNWQWRVRPESLRAEDAARLCGLARMYDR
ncbi:MAG: 4-alpha-glucanotransferase [Candidatus Solibacter sp.]